MNDYRPGTDRWSDLQYRPGVSKTATFGVERDSDELREASALCLTATSSRKHERLAPRRGGGEIVGVTTGREEREAAERAAEAARTAAAAAAANKIEVSSAAFSIVEKEHEFRRQWHAALRRRDKRASAAAIEAANAASAAAAAPRPGADPEALRAPGDGDAVAAADEPLPTPPMHVGPLFSATPYRFLAVVATALTPEHAAEAVAAQRERMMVRLASAEPQHCVAAWVVAPAGAGGRPSSTTGSPPPTADGGSGGTEATVRGYEDDGCAGAGERLLTCLDRAEARNCVLCVSVWYPDGALQRRPLGQRLKQIAQCGRAILAEYIEADGALRRAVLARQRERIEYAERVEAAAARAAADQQGGAGGDETATGTFLTGVDEDDDADDDGGGGGAVSNSSAGRDGRRPPLIKSVGARGQLVAARAAAKAAAAAARAGGGALVVRADPVAEARAREREAALRRCAELEGLAAHYEECEREFVTGYRMAVTTIVLQISAAELRLLRRATHPPHFLVRLTVVCVGVLLQLPGTALTWPSLCQILRFRPGGGPDDAPQQQRAVDDVDESASLSTARPPGAASAAAARRAVIGANSSVFAHGGGGDADAEEAAAEAANTTPDLLEWLLAVNPCDVVPSAIAEVRDIVANEPLLYPAQVAVVSAAAARLLEWVMSTLEAFKIWRDFARRYPQLARAARDLEQLEASMHAADVEEAHRQERRRRRQRASREGAVAGGLPLGNAAATKQALLNPVVYRGVAPASDDEDNDDDGDFDGTGGGGDDGERRRRRWRYAPPPVKRVLPGGKWNSELDLVALSTSAPAAIGAGIVVAAVGASGPGGGGCSGDGGGAHGAGTGGVLRVRRFVVPASTSAIARAQRRRGDYFEDTGTGEMSRFADLGYSERRRLAGRATRLQ